MNDELTKKLIRQLKILNIWVSLFGTLFLIAMVIVGILLFQLISFIGETNKQIQSVKTGAGSSLDVQGQACADQNALGEFLRNSTEVCN